MWRGDLLFSGGSFANQFTQFTDQIWSSYSFREQSIEPLTASIWQILLMLSPLLLALLFISTFSHVSQNTSFSFFNRPLLDANNLNPLHNSQRIFSLENFLRTFLGIPKVAVILGVTIVSTWVAAKNLIELPYQSLSDLLPQLSNGVFKVLFATTAAMFLLSGVDYAVEVFGFTRRQRMTDEDLREENRLQNVDPQIGARRQQIYQDLL